MPFWQLTQGLAGQLENVPCGFFQLSRNPACSRLIFVATFDFLN
jgi:hypothetical protein